MRLYEIVHELMLASATGGASIQYVLSELAREIEKRLDRIEMKLEMIEQRIDYMKSR